MMGYVHGIIITTIVTYDCTESDNDQLSYGVPS